MAEQTMVERVAKALCNQSCINDIANGDFSVGCRAPCDQWETFTEEARAAIAAMREPTKAMTDSIQFCSFTYDFWPHEMCGDS